MEPCYSPPGGEFVAFHPHFSPLPPPFPCSSSFCFTVRKKPVFQKALLSDSRGFPEAWMLNTSHNSEQFIRNKST